MDFFLVDTCNLRCLHCAVSSPLLSKANLPDLDLFAQSLAFLAPVMRSDQIILLGGEPLLNNEICSFIRVARRSGMFRAIRVITNGLLLPKMSEEFWKLADVVEVSLYPATREQLSPAVLEGFAKTASRFHTRLVLTPMDKFYPWFNDGNRIDDPRRVQEIFSGCHEAHDWSCHTLYGNRLYRCGKVHTLDRRLQEGGTPHPNFTDEDGVWLDGRAGLFQELDDYLESEKPLQACRYCLGTSQPWIEQRQMSVEEIRSQKSFS
jgi:hypothetical protein